ncbi:MAG: hypothetical protein GX552_07785, partial [Chloroflexi bacterium]|nr:hypothetical protein [Chloroflexota bacterium]
MLKPSSNALRSPDPEAKSGNCNRQISTQQIRERVQRRLLAELSPTIDTRNVDQVRPTLE